jgi:hypothetical protein
VSRAKGQLLRYRGLPFASGGQGFEPSWRRRTQAFPKPTVRHCRTRHCPWLTRREHPGLDQRGKRFRGRASRFMPCPSRQIQGFVKRRFALHVRHRVSERAPGVHTGAEIRAAPFQSFLTGFMMVDGCAAGLSLGRTDRTPQRSPNGSRGTCQTSAPVILAWRRDCGSGSEEDDG